MKELLSGNEALARGALEAGIEIACGYPGTPSSEILENVAKYKEIYSEWSVNEKVAMDAAAGAAYSGRRSMVTTKQVGMNGPFRLPVLHGLHGRGSRPRGDHGGRSGPVQLTKRAGQPPLRQARQVPHAGALRQSGMQGFHGRSRGHQRAVRHAGGHPHDHAHLALQVRGRTGRTGILWEAGGAVPPQHGEI